MLLVSICTLMCIAVFLVGSKRQRIAVCSINGVCTERFTANSKTLAVFAAILIAVSTLRYGWIDTYAYKEMYLASHGNIEYVNSQPYGVEAGWLYICYLLNFVSDSPKLMLFVSAAAIIGGYVTTIKRFSCDPIFSCIIFYCILYMDTNNGIRQMVAAAVLMLAFPLLLRKNVWGYLIYALVVLFAAQLHASAVVCCLIALVIIGKPLNYKVKLAILFGIVFCFAPDLLSDYIGELFNDSKYLFYLDMYGGMTFLRAFVTGILPAVLAFVYIRKCRNCGQRIEYTEGILINALFVNSIFVIMGCYMMYWNRMGFYTAFAPFVLIPKFVREIFVKSQRRAIKNAAIVLYFLFFAYNIYVNIGYGAIDDFYISWN